MSHEPSRYVQPEVSELRVNRLWANVASRLEQRPARAWRWVVLCSALAGVASGAWLLGKHRPWAGSAEHAALKGAKLQTAGEPLAVSLLDGSKLSLSARSELLVRSNQPQSVALALARGRADFDVAPQQGRSFRVVAGDVEVRVVGTQFTVEATPEAEGLRVQVSVLHGVVEVASSRRPGIVARVAAGQSWLQLPGASTDASASAGAPKAPAPASPSKPEAASAAASVSPPAGPSARELFEKAGASRRAGDAQGAARAYEELLRAHPADGRASLAAFELGRLRMDRLGDAAGAIAALERAVALNVGPTFREDALARLVSVYAKQGNFAACGRARDRYLASYPAGVHATAVSSRCGGR